LNQFSRQIKNGYVKPSFFLQENGASNTSSNLYQKVVENALMEIQSGRFQKVVPAAPRLFPLEDEFSCIDTFFRLCSNYADAFVSLVSAPSIGTWLGASPEALIEVDRSKIFSTVAVAGTQAYHPQILPQEVAWRQKEIEEQALVSRYIINCFKKIRLREFEESGPKTVVAGNLLHLKTTYTVNMEETNFPLLGSVMLDLLHPTSAVCGMPKHPAQEFLSANEDFDRELFSGYLGPVNINEETHLYVNLRCMQILPKYALLYAGAGVTEDSVPEKEWMETQLKCDTLLEVMNQ
jgi:isochorismate synthase